jgi:hypothetical protein
VVAKSKGGERSRGEQLRRHLLLVRHLVSGGALDRAVVRQLLECNAQEADRYLRELKKHWRELDESTTDGRRTLRLLRARGGVVHNSVAIAAAFGASLSSLFDGSTYGPGLREACREVVSLVRDPALFADVERKFYFVQRGGEVMLPGNAGTLDDLLEAVLHNRYVDLRYLRFNGTEEELTVKALSIATADHQLYLIGRDDDGRDHPYRFSRIKHAEVSVRTFEYPARVSYDPDLLFSKSIGVVVGEEFEERDVEIHLAPKWATFATHHRWHRTQHVDVRDDRVVVTMTVRLCPELKAWVLGFGEEAEVISPRELRDEVAHRTAAAAQRYVSRAR